MRFNEFWEGRFRELIDGIQSWSVQSLIRAGIRIPRVAPTSEEQREENLLSRAHRFAENVLRWFFVSFRVPESVCFDAT